MVHPGDVCAWVVVATTVSRTIIFWGHLVLHQYNFVRQQILARIQIAPPPIPMAKKAVVQWRILNVIQDLLYGMVLAKQHVHQISIATVMVSAPVVSEHCQYPIHHRVQINMNMTLALPERRGGIPQMFQLTQRSPNLALFFP